MQRKLSVRIIASLILSVMLFALPLGAALANSSTTVSVYAEESVSGNSTGTADDSATGSNTSDSSDGNGTGTDAPNPSEGADVGTVDNSNKGDSASDNGTGPSDPTPATEPAPEQEPKCICDSKCSQYDYNHACPVCSKNYKDCTYKDPSVKITIKVPDEWYSSGTSVKVKFKVEDILDTGNFAIKSVKAKIGQNGSYNDVTEDMYLEISENCTVYVLVTDANDKSYERSRSIKCFDTSKPTLNAAVSDGLLTIQASDNDSGIQVIYVNGYEFTDITNGTANIRLSQFDAGYEYFTITAMDNAGNVSEVYKTKNPYYKDPNSDDDSNPAEQLPKSAEATKPSTATATVTDHTKTDSNGNTTSTVNAAGTASANTSPEAHKKAELAKADAEETVKKDDENEEDKNLGKEFYTIEAASGKVFYLIIDRNGEEEMVYFLTEITENDLLNVTTDNSETLPKNSAALESQIPVTESALPNNNTDVDDTHEVETPSETTVETAEAETEETVEDEPEEPVKSNPILGYIIMAILGAGVIGAAYYFKVVKKRQDGDFIEDEDEDPEEEVYADDADESEKDEDDAWFDEGDQDYPEPSEEQKEHPAPTADDMEDVTVSDPEDESSEDVLQK
ncbi:CD1107 family mobile element protein [Oribacterium sp. NK2B42]|uniref:CD1107 family mobile element protein n=1 Tax=Oribacterium sp. NK2B42 TaxID=689781 RepID=UPI00042710B0|nr:DUF4366 domain-containing protein [Oribacterium sp. NK2B42]